MKPTANKLIKMALLVSTCACLGFVALIVSQEVAYVHAKVNRSTAADAPPQQLRWPDPVALPQLRISHQVTSDQLGADE